MKQEAGDNAGLYYPDGSYQSRRDIIRKSFLNGAHFEPRFETPLPVDKGFGDKAKNGEPSEMLYGCSVVLNRDTKLVEPHFDILEAHRAFTRSTEP